MQQIYSILNIRKVDRLQIIIPILQNHWFIDGLNLFLLPIILFCKSDIMI